LRAISTLYTSISGEYFEYRVKPKAITPMPLSDVGCKRANPHWQGDLLAKLSENSQH
jgi:hypothetical protein